jgi:hypothetical protein
VKRPAEASALRVVVVNAYKYLLAIAALIFGLKI